MRPRDRYRRHHIETRVEYHPAKEITAVVLDYMPSGYYADPHREHRKRPVAQAVGTRHFILIDGVPLEPVEPFEYVSLAREITRTLPVGISPRGRPLEKTIRLACMPGADRNIYCYPYEVKEPSLLRLVARVVEDENPKVIVVTGLDALKSVAKERNLPEKILVVPRRPLSYEELSDFARSTLEAAVRKIIEDEEDVFVEFFNIASPINIRLHSLNLLKGIGKRTLRALLDRRPFKSLAEVKRVIRFDPVESIVEKIVEEIRGDAKYYLFVPPPPGKEAPFFNYLDEARRRAKKK